MFLACDDLFTFSRLQYVVRNTSEYDGKYFAHLRLVFEETLVNTLAISCSTKDAAVCLI